MLAALGATAAGGVTAVSVIERIGRALASTKTVATSLGAKVIIGALVASTVAAGVVSSRARGTERAGGHDDGPRVALSHPTAAASALAGDGVHAAEESSTSPPPPLREETSPVATPMAERRPKAKRPVGRASPGAHAPAESRIDLEVALLREGTMRLSAGDPNRALMTFDEHARIFPNGSLEEERAAGRVRALCALGRIADARAESERFLSKHPGSPYGPSLVACSQ